MSGTHERPRAPEGTVLAFDFGTRKVGVALGNTISGIARPLLTLHEPSASARFTRIAAIIAEWEPVLLVSGRPLHADGTTHRTTALADEFARELARRFQLPVEQVDERYTTQIADAERRARGARTGKGREPERDAVAAQIILQSWLDQRATPMPRANEESA